MKVTISTAPPDDLACETLILGFFSDERPPKGYCGLVDWRLNGMISLEIAAGRITGGFLEKVACSYPGRIPVSRILLVGLGALSELTYDRLYNAGFEIARAAAGIAATDLAFPVPGAGRGPLQLAGMAEALVTGLFDGFPREADRLAGLDLEIPGKPDQLFAVLQGLERFRKRARASGVEIPEIETRTVDGAYFPRGDVPIASASCPPLAGSPPDQS